MLSLDEIKRMDIKEFREKGFLQEVNRQFFHPLGLALEIIIDEKGDYTLGGVWDYREDPEGIFYDVGTIDSRHIKYIQNLRDSKHDTRVEWAKENGTVVDSSGKQLPT